MPRRYPAPRRDRTLRYGHPRGGVRHIEMAHAVFTAGIAHGSFNLIGDVLHLGPAGGAHTQRADQATRTAFLIRFHRLVPCAILVPRSLSAGKSTSCDSSIHQAALPML